MRRLWISAAVLLTALICLVISEPSKLSPNRIVTDISWPNCGLNMARNSSGIVGVDGGLALRTNPCLAQEASDFTHVSVYVNTGYPGTSYALKYQNWPQRCASNDEECLAYNYGYNSGSFDINYSLEQGIIANRWWLDVEIDNSWSSDYRINRQALQGTIDAIGQVVGKNNLGFYSTALQWDQITQNWQNGYPEWLATGGSSEASAVAACKAKTFSGGPILLTQYTPYLDANYICD